MATKKSKSGKMLEYVTITIPGGFSSVGIADGLIASSFSIEKIEKFTTWRQVMAAFKDGLMDCGYNGLSYLWEREYDYDNKHARALAVIKKLNPDLD